MLPIETILTFILASAALGISPGPDNIFVLTQSAMNGRKAGFLVTLGLCTGLLVHTSVVALGIVAIFQTSAVAFNTLKITGALYLLYLAWQAFSSSTTPIDEAKEEQASWKQLYSRGIIMNITNPKVVIFFLAFLPQFTNPSVGSITGQLLILGLLFIGTTLIVFSTIAWSAGLLGEWLKGSKKAHKIINRLAGIVFIGLALKLFIG